MAAARWLAAYEIWPVAILAAASVLSNRFLPLAVAVAAFFWIVRWLGGGRFGQRTPADLAIGLLLIMGLIALVITAVPEETIPDVLRLLVGVALYYAIANWATSVGRLKWVALGSALAGVALSLAAPFSVAWYTTKLPFISADVYSRFSVVVGDSIHPNVMGGYLVILLVIALAWLSFDWARLSRVGRLFLGGAIGLMGVVLILTQSRGAWMAGGVALLGLVTLRWRRGWLVWPAALLSIIVLSVILGGSNLVDTIISNPTLSSTAGRMDIWSRAIAMIRDFPITGIGMGSFVEVVDSLYPFSMAAPGAIIHAHNLYLQLAVDLGLPGLIAWLAIVGLVCIASWQVYQAGRAAQNAWVAGLGAGLLAAQAALIVHGFTDAVTWGVVRAAPLIWVVWGLAVAAANLCATSQSFSNSNASEADRLILQENPPQ
jgi:putative inorganic carbon (hco3(-)) transporter